MGHESRGEDGLGIGGEEFPMAVETPASSMNGRDEKAQPSQMNAISPPERTHDSYFVSVTLDEHFTCVHWLQTSQDTALLARVTPFSQTVHGYDTRLVFLPLSDEGVGPGCDWMSPQRRSCCCRRCCC